ncbi:MAG: hypothetical protein AB1500_12315 [Bacillota bacterium]
MLKIAGFRVIHGPSTVGRVYREALAELARAIQYHLYGGKVIGSICGEVMV